MTGESRVAVVTGANRGIGLAIAERLADRGLHVLAGVRDEAAGRAALGGRSRSLEVVRLDVAEARTPGRAATAGRPFEALLRRVEQTGASVVVHNAGISLDGFGAEVAEQTVRTNFFGALDLHDALLPHLTAGARIVLVSSGMGDRAILGEALRREVSRPMSRAELVAFMERFVDAVRRGAHRAEGWPSNAYSVSKIGMTALAGVIARELEASRDPRRILVNAACPGWVRTRMGGSSAPRSVEEGADTPVWLALLPESGPTGGFFRDRAPADW